MTRKFFLARRVLAAVVDREKKLEECLVEEAEWMAVEQVCQFLEDTASATEHQMKSVFVNLSLISRIFEKLEQIF